MSITGFNRRRRSQQVIQIVQAIQKEENLKPINKMTVKELIEYAKEQNIELVDAKKKEEILEIIKNRESPEDGGENGESEHNN